MKYMIYCLLICSAFSCLSLKTKSIKTNGKIGNCDRDYLFEIATKAIKREYGKKTYNSYKPYKIGEYNDSTYIIDGTVYTKKGGTPTVFIDKEKCTIRRVTHYK